MKNYVLLFVLLFAISDSQAQNLPTENQPLIWLRADIIGDSLNQWVDYSGNGFDAHLQTNQTFPSDTIFNYNAALNFGVSNQALEVSYIGKRKEYLKVFMVYKAADSLNEYGLWSIKLDSFIEVGLSSYEILNVRKDLLYDSTTSIIPTINSLAKSWRRVDVDSNICRLLIGGTDSLSYKGIIAEFIMFNKRLTKADNKKVHSYLAIKYGITLDRLDYVNSDDEVILPYKSNKAFFNDVASIARDDSLQLYQKQSSGNAGQSELIISAGNLQIYNDSNHSQLNNMDYLIWGHNGDSLNIDTDTSNTAVFSYLLKRKWMINVNGVTASEISTNIQIDASAFDTTQNMVLVINPDSASVFDPNTCFIIYPDSVDSLQHYYFTDINWDSDSSGSDGFTFMINQNTAQQKIYSSASVPDNDNNQSVEFKCQVYPNPTDGSHTVEIHAAEKSRFTIKYYNAEGRLIDTKECEGGQNYFIKNQISQPGIYLISVENFEIQQTFKLIVK